MYKYLFTRSSLDSGRRNDWLSPFTPGDVWDCSGSEDGTSRTVGLWPFPLDWLEEKRRQWRSHEGLTVQVDFEAEEKQLDVNKTRLVAQWHKCIVLATTAGREQQALRKHALYRS